MNGMPAGSSACISSGSWVLFVVCHILSADGCTETRAKFMKDFSFPWIRIIGCTLSSCRIINEWEILELWCIFTLFWGDQRWSGEQGGRVGNDELDKLPFFVQPWICPLSSSPHLVRCSSQHSDIILYSQWDSFTNSAQLFLYWLSNDVHGTYTPN